MTSQRSFPSVLLCTATVALVGLAAALFRITPPGVVSVLTQTPTPEAGWLTTPTSSYQPVALVESQALLTISTIVLLVLLAAALVAGIAFWVLVLTRYTRRKAELATRSALGATPREIMTELSAPIMRVTVLGALSGVVLAGALTLIVFALWPGVVQRSHAVALLAGLAGGFLAATLLAAATVAALWLFLVRGSLSAALRAGERATASLGETRIREVLTVLQVATCVVLLAVGAVLADLPERRMASETAGKLVVRAGRSTSELAPAQRVALLEKVLRGAHEQPAVQAESIASAGALLGVSLRDRIYSECTTCIFSLGYLPFAIIRMHMHSVGPGYFSLVGVPLLRGRDFTSHDRIGAPLVVIVNDAFVRSLFGPRGNGLGKVVRLSDGFGEAHRIVGVIADEVALAPGAPGAGQPVVYFPALQYPPRAFDLITRSSAARPPALAGLFEWSEPARLHDLRAAAVAPLNFASASVRGLAVLCFLLGAFGLYATISTLVGGRRRELGIRVALGSTPWGLLRHVTGYGLLLTFVGIVFGLAGSFAAQRILDEVLPSARINVQSLVLAALALVLMVVAGVARPAWRSAREQPSNPLR